MSDKGIIIIGAGIEQEKMYHVARAMDLKIICTDRDPNAPCVRLADKFINASTRDPVATVMKLQKHNIKEPLGVCTLANDVPETVASVAAFYKLPGLKVQSAKKFASKVLMKKSFASKGVLSAKYEVTKTYFDALSFMERSNAHDFILKPSNGRGSLGVRFFSKHELNIAMYSEVENIANKDEVLIEEFIPGLQLSTESYIQDNKVYTAAIAERNYSKLSNTKPYVLEDGGTIPANVSVSIKKKIDSAILLAANALGLEEGCIKGDLVIRDNSVYVIEMAGRLSGGWFASDQIPEATGIDLVTAQLLTCMGQRVDTATLTPTKTTSTTIRYIWPPQGKIKKITGMDFIESDASHVKSGLFFKPGDFYTAEQKHSDRFGYIIARGNDYYESIANADKLINSIKVDYYD